MKNAYLSKWGKHFSLKLSRFGVWVRFVGKSHDIVNAHLVKFRQCRKHKDCRLNLSGLVSGIGLLCAAKIIGDISLEVTSFLAELFYSKLH